MGDTPSCIQVPASPSPSWVALDNLINLSVLLFPDLSSGDDVSSYIESLQGLNKIMHL